MPTVYRIPTLPSTPTEITTMLAACDLIENSNPAGVQRARLRALALILTLLYTGFRISDVVRLERTRVDIRSGKLLVRMMKTREPLYIRLPHDALTALAAVPVESPYYFWSGDGKLQTALRSARQLCCSFTSPNFAPSSSFLFILLPQPPRSTTRPTSPACSALSMRPWQPCTLAP
jgi:integrase